MGARARERVLDEHTYAHRARQVLRLLGLERRRCTCMTARSSRSCPAFDEEAAIGPVVEEIARVRPGDRRGRGRRRLDGRDGARAAAAAGATVVRLPFNLGIGGAVQTGFRYALERGYDVAVRLDGDGQHDPARAPEAARARSSAARRTSSPARASARARTATGRRSPGGSGSRGSRSSSRCSRASG